MLLVSNLLLFNSLISLFATASALGILYRKLIFSSLRFVLINEFASVFASRMSIRRDEAVYIELSRLYGFGLTKLI